MFGNLKNRFRKKEYDDLEDIRSNVLGDFRGMPPQPEPDFPRKDMPVWDDPMPQKLGDRFGEPQGFSSIDTRFPAQPAPSRERDYDLMDRLSLIESQLSAI